MYDGKWIMTKSWKCVWWMVYIVKISTIKLVPFFFDGGDANDFLWAASFPGDRPVQNWSTMGVLQKNYVEICWLLRIFIVSESTQRHHLHRTAFGEGKRISSLFFNEKDFVNWEWANNSSPLNANQVSDFNTNILI